MLSRGGGSKVEVLKNLRQPWEVLRVPWLPTHLELPTLTAFKPGRLLRRWSKDTWHRKLCPQTHHAFFVVPLLELHHIIYYTILYYTILYYTILYYTILYYTILYYTILYYTILYYTILYYTILYYTILYYTIY